MDRRNMYMDIWLWKELWYQEAKPTMFGYSYKGKILN